MAGPDIIPRRSAGKASRRAVEIEWFIQKVMRHTRMTLKQRMMVAGVHLERAVKENISDPVTKLPGGQVLPESRSRPEEFPKAETSNLMRSIFRQVKVRARGKFIDLYVGTPVAYGLILETRMNRKLFVATLQQELPAIRRIVLYSRVF